MIRQSSTPANHKILFSAVTVVTFQRKPFHGLCDFQYATCRNRGINFSQKKMISFASVIKLAPGRNVLRQIHHCPIVADSSSFSLSVPLSTKNACIHKKIKWLEKQNREDVIMETSLFIKIPQLKRKCRQIVGTKSNQFPLVLIYLQVYNHDNRILKSTTIQ